MTHTEVERAELPGRRRVAVGAAAVGVLALALVVGLLVGRGEPGGPSSATADPAASPTAVPTPAPDLQAVGLRGVEVHVPRSWRVVGPGECLPATGSVVVDRGLPIAAFLRACRAVPPDAVVVRIGPTGTAPATGSADGTTTTPTTVDGQPALRGTGPAPTGPARQQTVLVLPGPGVVVAVEGTGPQTDQVLDTVTVRRTDAHGCPVLLAAAAPRPDGPAHPVSTDRLVPGPPARAVVCRYSEDRLADGFDLTSAELDATVRTLNTLPLGATVPGPGYWLAPQQCELDRHRGFVVRFGDADGSSTAVGVRVSGCDGLTATDGVRTTGVDGTLLRTLVQHGYDGAFPDPAGLP